MKSTSLPQVLCVCLTLLLGHALPIVASPLASAIGQPGWTLSTGGNANWTAQSSVALSGGQAARSGQIGHNQESWMETTLPGPGLLRFWWKVSSEPGFDFLGFYLDGTLQDQIGGEVNWTQQTYLLPNSQNVVRWRYFKDPSVSQGMDAGFVDDVTYTQFAGPGKIEVTDSIAPGDDLLVPFGQTSLGVTRTETIRIRNTDPDHPLVITRIQLRPTENGTSSFATASQETKSTATHADDEPVAASSAPPPPDRPGRRDPGPDWSRPHQPSSIIVRYKEGTAIQARASLHQALGGSVARRMQRLPLEVVELPPQADPRAMAAAYARNPAVAYAEPNYRIRLNQIPNDPSFPSQWSLRNTGQSGGLPGADISALQAWQYTTGSPEIVVAIIDSGVDYNHPDLAANMWVNPNPTFNDIHGARWTSGNGNVTSGDPMDDHGHGTHVAGIVGAVANNGIGIAGVAPNVRLMALKFLASNGEGYTSDAIAALEYAIDQGAHITNNSWGGGSHSNALRDMIAAAADANQLFIAAAGNDGTNNDTTPSYPASYNLPNVISVANSTRTDARSSLSNYGASTVHLAAPGTAILSTLRGGGYGTMSGTSMAAPHVAGVAALILSLTPDAGFAEVKETILGSVTPLPHWTSQVISGGRLNAAEALRHTFADFRLTGLPAFPFTLPAGRSLLIEVAYQPITAAFHEAIVAIESLDPNQAETFVHLTGTAVADDLEVVEEAGMSFEGLTGGPFLPASITYTLRNNGAQTISWAASTTAAWLSVSPPSGSLSPGAETAVSIAVNSAADTLSEGLHEKAVVFANPTTGFSAERRASLQVLPVPGQLVITDSISPSDDGWLPFPQTTPGEGLEEYVTLHNIDASNAIRITDVTLLGTYREDFTAAAPLHWHELPLDGWSIANNRYRATKPGFSGFLQATYTGEVWANGVFETRVGRQGSSFPSAILLLRASPDFDLNREEGSAILLGVAGDGYYFVARYFDGLFSWIQPWTEANALLTGSNANNIVTVNLNHDHLHLFTNDQLIWSGVIPGPFRAGRVGLAGHTTPAYPTTHFFDYIDIREPIATGLLAVDPCQSWHNAHPVSTEILSPDRSSSKSEKPPAEKPVSDDPVITYSDIRDRQETFRLPSSLSLPFTIPAGGEHILPIRFNPDGETAASRILRINSNDPTQPVTDLQLSGSSLLDDLIVSPLGTVSAAGPIGGPFPPVSAPPLLHNTGTTSLSWTIGTLPAWITVTPPSGTLLPGAYAAIELTINSAADLLPQGNHSDVIQVVNTNTGFARNIPITLEVRPTLCQAVKACGLTWTTGGSQPWFGQYKTTFRSSSAAQSGLIGNNQSSWIATSVQGPGRIEFWWKVSSELHYDFLTFQINGATHSEISGEVDWHKIVAEVPEGTHAFRWEFEKDVTIAAGADAGWLDEVTWTPIPSRREIALAAETVGFGVVNVGETALRSLRINNPGNSTLTIQGISLPDGYAANWTQHTIAPGSYRDLEITFAPATPGEYPGTLTFTTDATHGPNEVAITGTAMPVGQPFELANEQILPGLAASAGEKIRFLIDVPPGREFLEVRIFGGAGDADLYVRHASPPSLTLWDYAPLLVGNKETVRIDNPAEGPWHFLVHAFADFSNLSITARYPTLHLSGWADWIGLPQNQQGLLDRHGPLNLTTLHGYAFGRDPRQLTAADLPRIETTEGMSDRVRLVYRLQTAAPEISVTLESTADLETWTLATPVETNVLDDNRGVETREAIFDAAHNTSLFLRARIHYETTTE